MFAYINKAHQINSTMNFNITNSLSTICHNIFGIFSHIWFTHQAIKEVHFFLEFYFRSILTYSCFVSK